MKQFENMYRILKASDVSDEDRRFVLGFLPVIGLRKVRRFEYLFRDDPDSIQPFIDNLRQKYEAGKSEDTQALNQILEDEKTELRQMMGDDGVSAEDLKRAEIEKIIDEGEKKKSAE